MIERCWKDKFCEENQQCSNLGAYGWPSGPNDFCRKARWCEEHKVDGRDIKIEVAEEER